MSGDQELAATLTALTKRLERLERRSAQMPWNPIASWDLQFDGAGSYTPGNALKFGEYRLDGDMVDFRFTYKIGSTTGWPTASGSFIRAKLPYPMASGPTNGRVPVGTCTAFDASTGLQAFGLLVLQPSDTAAAYMIGPPNYSVNTASIGAMVDFWQQTGSNEYPFRSGTGSRQAWALNDEITGSGRYRAVVT